MPSPEPWRSAIGKDGVTELRVLRHESGDRSIMVRQGALSMTVAVASADLKFLLRPAAATDEAAV